MTKLVMAKLCKDCVVEGVVTSRPTPHPGPRCVTHHRAFRKAQKAQNRERVATGTYGLSTGDLGKLRALSGGFCMVYGCRAQGKTRDLSIEHDHVSHEVRGLVCTTHNDWFGRAGDDPAVFMSLALYLLDPPARRVLTMLQVSDSGAIHPEVGQVGYYDEFVRYGTLMQELMQELDKAMQHAKEIRLGDLTVGGTDA